MKKIIKLIPVIFVCFMIIFDYTASIGNARPLCNPVNPGTCGPDELETKAKAAAIVLYGQMDDTGLRMFCSGMVFERNDNKYHILTAAHCISEDDLQRIKVAAIPIRWFINFEDSKNPGFLEVRLIGAGYQSNGDDFGVLELEIDKEMSFIPLSTDDPMVGEDFINVASPMGLGKQLFYGQVSKDRLDVSIISGTLNWRNNILAQTSSGPGSSGSAIVSRCSNKIIGILLGSIAYPHRGTPNIVIAPISRFKKFYSGIKSETYKYFDKDQTTANSFWASQTSGKNHIQALRDRAFYGLIYDMYTGNEIFPSKKE